MTNNKKARIEIRGLELSVRLGWPDNERKEPQTVQIDLDIQFASPPKACETDNLNDTYCYANIAHLLREKFQRSPIHLLEHLSAEIYKVIKATLPNETNLLVKVTKHPKIEGLTQGVSFTYGD